MLELVSAGAGCSMNIDIHTFDGGKVQTHTPTGLRSRLYASSSQCLAALLTLLDCKRPWCYLLVLHDCACIHVMYVGII